jgi:DNA-binding NtrC family response regulator
MAKPLQALLIEDSEDDATLIVHELEHGGYEVLFERIDTSRAIEEALGRKEWDIIICDHAMPHICAPEALQIVKRICPDTPFVIVSGWITDELAEAAKKEGARDFVRKNNLVKLVPIVQRELKKSKPKGKKGQKGKKKRT